MRESRGDLCSACCKMLACAKRMAADEPMFECEEFAKQHGSPWEIPEDRCLSRGEVQGARKLLKGLCSDCENRWDCCLAHAVEGGVWHCEEYR